MTLKNSRTRSGDAHSSLIFRHAARTTPHFNSPRSAIGDIADIDRHASPICSSISLPHARARAVVSQVERNTRGLLFIRGLPLAESRSIVENGD